MDLGSIRGRCRPRPAEADRLEVLTHDLNNALTPILGYADLLLSGPDLAENPERLREYLGVIREHAAEAREVVRRLAAPDNSAPEAEAFVPLRSSARTESSATIPSGAPDGAGSPPIPAEPPSPSADENLVAASRSRGL